jgi:cyclopropane-fatty-acyl-phospholipid synthase
MTLKAFVSGGSANVPAAVPPKPNALRSSSRLDRWCVTLLAHQFLGAQCLIRLWDGWTVSCSDGPPFGTVTISDRATLWRLIRKAELAFGEGYMDGSIEIAGDLTRMMESVNLALLAKRSRASRPSSRPGPAASTVKSARHHVHHHYDIGNEFFRLWLDEAMVYTCAYFEEPDQGLEEAQQAKLDYVCRKLELQPGDRVIEAGCGWGSLAIHMAKHYRATVHAYNISSEQLLYAREEAARQGVTDRVTFIDGDFRSITGECDAFVSVGMLEHVGSAEYRALGEIMDRVMDARAGRGLLHFCGRNRPTAVAAWTQRYIFPGGYVPALSEVTTSVLEPWNFSVLDVENLRRHYAATVRHWRQRFEESSAPVTRMFDDRFVRMWRMYLACAEACFTSGDMQLFQVTFGRATDNARRWTRSDLYTPTQQATAPDTVRIRHARV